MGLSGSKGRGAPLVGMRWCVSRSAFSWPARMAASRPRGSARMAALRFASSRSAPAGEGPASVLSPDLTVCCWGRDHASDEGCDPASDRGCDHSKTSVPHGRVALQGLSRSMRPPRPRARHSPCAGLVIGGSCALLVLGPWPLGGAALAAQTLSPPSVDSSTAPPSQERAWRAAYGAGGWAVRRARRGQ
jgi:hypothetical protein